MRNTTLLLFALLTIVLGISGGRIAAAEPPFCRDWQTIAGQTLHVEPAITKKPTLLVFWASWCASCNAEVPRLKKLAQRAGEGLDIISISLDTDRSKAQAFIDRHQPGYPVVLDPQMQLTDELGTKGTPYFVLIDGSGTITLRSPRFDQQLGQALTAAGVRL